MPLNGLSAILRYGEGAGKDDGVSAGGCREQNRAGRGKAQVHIMRPDIFSLLVQRAVGADDAPRAKIILRRTRCTQMFAQLSTAQVGGGLPCGLPVRTRIFATSIRKTALRACACACKITSRSTGLFGEGGNGMEGSRRHSFVPHFGD